MIPLPNPFEQMGSVAAKIVVEGWTAAMLSLWNGGLWVLRLVLGWVDTLLTPDLGDSGPGAALYRVTFWLAASLMLIMGLVQLANAAFRRDGQGLARALVGLLQFAVVWVSWIGYAVAVVAASGALSRSLMQSLMGVTSWNSWQPWAPIQVKDVTDAAAATVLGVMGMLIWVAAIAHVVVMLTRAAALMVIVAATPIAAAGLANGSTSSWFWQSFRWFHAAALTPVIVVMVTGIGMKFAEGVATGQASAPLASIATAVPAVVLICIASFSPLALFKLLAFVDPGTASGAAMRAGLAATGGLQGLLRGKPTASSGQAAVADDSGHSAGEADADAATSARVTGAVAGGMSALVPVGATAAAGLSAAVRLGMGAAAVGADVTNQMGIGHNAYYPDYQGSGGDAARANREAQDQALPDRSGPAPGQQRPDPAPPDEPRGASATSAGSSAAKTAPGTASAAGGAAAEAAVIA